MPDACVINNFGRFNAKKTGWFLHDCVQNQSQNVGSYSSL
jgi:hypothetical protein